MKAFIFFNLFLFSNLCLSACKKDTTISEKVNTPVAADSTHARDLTPKGMVYIQGAKYKRGSNKKQENGVIYREEAPVHKVEVSSFYIDQTEVTNAQFKKFVDATGYITFAEKGLTRKDFPNAPAEMLKPGASIFSPPSGNVNPYKTNPQSWWSFTSGANWRSPFGPGSDIKDKMDHPVVCVNHNDAEAYAKWAGKRLPTEAEWELAARGGLDHNTYSWGNQRLAKDNKPLANTFQGKFPATNTKLDGYIFTAPVKSYPPNGYGLYDMAGNVWEMCSDYFHPAYYHAFVKNPHPNPTGPKQPITDYEAGIWRSTGITPKASPQSHKLMHLKVTKGGSFLCHVSYCLRYRPSARHQTELLTPTNHTGFRCVKDVDSK